VASSCGGRSSTGRLGERVAAAHFERLGFSILARNARTQAGELDLIASDGVTLVFVEVKTRMARSNTSSLTALDPLLALRPRQRARVRRAAVAWLGEARARSPRARTLRFDAVGVLLDRGGRLLALEHLQDAW
jgi:putative endonuclease